MTEIAKIAAVNMEKANMEADMLFAQEGADFLKQYKDKMGLVNTIKMLQEQVKGGEKMYEFIEKEKSRAAEKEAQRNFQLAMQQRRENIQIVLQNRREIQRGLDRDAKGAGGRGGAANARYAFNINESFGQAATDLLNITTMPSNTTLGSLSGMTGKSGDNLTTALRNTFARKITRDDERLMQQLVSGLDFHMARALGGGYATSSSKAAIETYKEQVAQAGDSPAAQAMFLARMKQELKVLAKAFNNHPGSNEGYVQDMKDYIDALDQAIAFNVKDVTEAVRGSRQSFSERFTRSMLSPIIQRLPSTQTPPQGGSAPSGETTWSTEDQRRLDELERKARGAQ